MCCPWGFTASAGLVLRSGSGSFQNHCKDSLLALSPCQHQKLAGYFCLGRCTFCCKGLFILCLPCSQVTFSTVMQEETLDSSCCGGFSGRGCGEQKRGSGVRCSHRGAVVSRWVPTCAGPHGLAEQLRGCRASALGDRVSEENQARGRRCAGEAPAPCHSLGTVALTPLKEPPWVLQNLLWS